MKLKNNSLFRIQYTLNDYINAGEEFESDLPDLINHPFVIKLEQPKAQRVKKNDNTTN